MDLQIMLVAGSLLLVVLRAVWRRFLFLKGDLAAYVMSRGGQILHRRRRKFEAQLGSLRVLARFDHPFFNYAPLPQISLRTFQQYGGYHPRYMLRMSRVDLFWLADLGELPETKLSVERQQGRVDLEHPMGAAGINAALREAAEARSTEDLELAVRFRRQALQVTVLGGTWLGGAFGTRIAEAVAFTERLAEILRARYRSLDPEAWTIQRVRDDFTVQPRAMTSSSR
ncbi:MAG: hypothetical protein ACE5I2_14440 [Anaerolineae bacterium]